MSPAPLRVDSFRHPWLAEFERAPKEAFGDLLAGYARVHPYERADAPDAARMLFGPLDADDPARQALGRAIVEWLEERRRQSLPADPYRLQRYVREVCEAFEIVSLLSVADAASELRRGFIKWSEWVAGLVLSPSRDARAEYWRMLALTQPLVADASSIEPHGLAPFWLQVCTESGSETGGRLAGRHLTVGLLGLRRLPGAPLDGTETPWLAGLAHWALARKPSDEAFLAEWRPLKQLYPSTPALWRKRVADVLAAKPFKGGGIEAPAWWGADPDLGAMRGRGSGAVLAPPPKEPRDRLLKSIRQGQALASLKSEVERIVAEDRRYAENTGDPYFLIRTFTNIGMRLISHGADARAERGRIAQALAQEALQWEPRNVHARSLLGDALVAQGAFETAELVGWEFVRRFPDNPYARNQLAELLIADRRVPEAEAVVAAALASGALDVVTYALQARLKAHAGNIDVARRAIAEGLRIDDTNVSLRRFEALLNAGKELPLISRAFARAEEVGVDVTIDPSADPSLSPVLVQGRGRRLRFRLDSEDDERRAKAREEVERWLEEDSASIYAKVLAARQGIWAAESSALPPVAVAFEDALAREDRARLEALAERVPRLEALILVARAVLGDAEAAEQVEHWLRSGAGKDEEPAVAALRSLMRPVLRVIEGGKSAAEAIADNRSAVIHALHDANEATLGDALLAA